MFTLNSFYRSKEWELFRKQIILERLNDNGDTIDEVTGRPIVKMYDVILHHKIPLTEGNVNDYNISLNPDNIMIVSHKTHNEIHKRFGAYTRHIYIVYGSPCSGKTTFVNERALKDDLIIDIDRIFEAINNGRSNRLYDNVMQVYRLLIDMVKTRNGKWVNAYIIRGFPLKGERERLAAMLDAELVYIDTDEQTCLERAYKRAPDYNKFVLDWWQKFQK